MDTQTTRKLRVAARTVSSWLGQADGILEDVSRALDGGLPSKALAAASIMNRVLDAIVPSLTAEEQLAQAGYKLFETSVSGFLCETLYSSDLPHEQEQSEEEARRIVYWCSRKIAAVYRGDALDEGPFYKAEGGREALIQAVGGVVWKADTDLMLGLGRSASSQTGKFQLVPMGDPGVFIGEPGLDWYVKRVKRHEGEATRSVLLAGPSGAGKSTLGRLIAKELGGGRTLKVSSRALRAFSVNDVLDCVELVQPEVLLLDDVMNMISDRGEGGAPHEAILDLLESLRGRVRLVVLTGMDDYGRVEDQGYFSGMRPGRVDEILVVKRPSARVAEKVLAHYLGGEAGMAALGVKPRLLADVAKRCAAAGMTGAYVAEVARRLKVHGLETYKGEIQQVAACSPGEVRRRGRVVRRRRKTRRAVRARLVMTKAKAKP